MSGMLRWSFHQGNRSEYLAHYILSALGVAVPVPRQDDIGADFHCTLAEEKNGRLTFKQPFLVQTKSESVIGRISYGGTTPKGEWKGHEVDWLFSQELPILIGVVNKTTNVLRLYTTSNMWSGRYKWGNVAEVVLQPDVPDNTEIDIPRPHVEEVAAWKDKIGNGLRMTVPLGPPIVSIEISETENPDKRKQFSENLSWAISLEQMNITYRRSHVHFSRWPLRIATNNIMTGPVRYGIGLVGAALKGAHVREQLAVMTPIFGAIALNYKLQGDMQRFSELKKLAQIFPPESQEAQEIKSLVADLFE